MKTLNWQLKASLLATGFALMMSPLSWQFSLGVIVSAWITFLDHKYGKEQ